MRTHLRTLLPASLLLLAVSLPVGAQTKDSTHAKTGLARIVGVVLDSVNGGFLTDATVLLDGAQKSVDTDSAGRFTFDSVPPGTYQLGVFHPLLDALDISIATKPFHAGADSASVVILSVPSPTTIVTNNCPNQKNESAMFGHVSDPATLEPIAGAEVSIAWQEIEVSKSVGIRSTPHLLHDTTDRNGAYAFCGLPSGLQATIKAQRGAWSTGEIAVSMGNRPVEVQGRSLFLSKEDSTTKTGKAVVTGVVSLEGNPPNAVSRVELEGTDIVAVTNEKGEFTLANVPSGSRNILARHIGYAVQTVPVDLNPRVPQHVTIKLPKFVAMMDPVLITARRNLALDKVGFNQRKKSGFGYFIDPDKIARIHPIYVADILRRVPGLRVVYGANGESSVVSTRDIGSGCVEYYVDDMPFQELTPGDINSFINGGEISAVEVYQSGTAPPQYSRHAGRCTSILIWTRFRVHS